MPVMFDTVSTQIERPRPSEQAPAEPSAPKKSPGALPGLHCDCEQRERRERRVEAH